jgi:hypothetical protein
MFSLFRKSTPKVFFIVLALCLGLSSCLTPGQEKGEKNKVFKLGQHKTWLEQPNSSDPFFNGQKFDHPFRLNPDVLEKQIKSFQYKGLALLSKTRKVFPDPMEKEMISLILIALDKAGPAEIVKFHFNLKEGDTRGDVFISGNKIHWRFAEISGKEYSSHGSRNWLDSWKLIPGKNQKFHGSKGLWGKSPVKNWIVMPVEASDFANAEPLRSTPEEGKEETDIAEKEAPTPRKPMREEPASTEDADMELEKSLSRLKRLREKGLITENDYNNKKAALLEKHF